jgi:hypothetical protein
MANIYIKNQGNYGGTYDFTDEANGTTAPTGWTNNDDDPAHVTSYSKIIDNKVNHKKVIEQYCSGATDAKIYHTLSSSQLSGIAEFWIHSNDVSHTSSFLLRDSGNDTVCWGGFTADQIHCQANNLVVPSDNTWYHISIRFRATGGDALPSPDDDLAEGNCKMYVNEVEYGDWALSKDVAVDNIQVSTNVAGGHYVHWDSFGFSWDTSYTVGDNLTAPNTDITAYVTECIINHKARDIPTCSMVIYGQTIEYDDIILITDSYTSNYNSETYPGHYVYKNSVGARDETLRSAPSDTSQGTFTDNSGGSTDAYVIDKFNGVAYPIQLEDYDAGDSAELDYALTSAQASGSFEFLIASTDPTYEATVRLYDEGAAVAAGIMMDADLWYYWDNNGSWQAMGGTAPVVAKWYRCTITFDCSDDSLSYAIVALSDGTAIASASSKTMDSSPTTIDDIKYATQDADNYYLVFIAGIGMTWDSDYTLGDNANKEVTLAAQTIFEGRVITKDERYMQSIELEALSVDMAETMPGEEDSLYEPDGYSSVANYSEEVFSEIITDKCAKATATAHSEVYRGTHSLVNATNGTTPMGMLEAHDTTTAPSVQTASLGGHKNYIKITDDLDPNKTAYVDIHFEPQTYGTIEFEWYSDDVTDNQSVYLGDATPTYILYAHIEDDNLYVRDSVGLTDTLETPTDATWHKVRIDFECTTGGYKGLGQYEFNIYFDGNDPAGNPYSFWNNQANISLMRLYAGAADWGYYFCIDSIGFSWDPAYTAASDPTDTNTYQNSHILIDKFEVGSYTLDLALSGSRSCKRLGDTIGDLDTFTWALTPAHAIIYTEGALDTDVDLAAANCWDIDGIEFVERFNKVLVKGGYTAVLARVYGTANNTDSQTTYGIKLLVRFYADVKTVAEANNIAASILTLQENAPKIVELSYRNDAVGFIQPGETVTVPASTIQYDGNTTYVDSGQWILAALIYDVITGLSRLTLVNSLYFEYDWNLTEEQEALIAQK